MKVGIIYNVILDLVADDFRNLYALEHERNVRPQIKKIVEQGILFLEKELAPWRIKLPSNIGRIVFKSQTPVADLEEVTAAIRERHFSDHDKAVFAVNIMEQLHDQWVWDNTNFLLKQMDRPSSMKYLCMPLLLLGFDSAQIYLSFVAPLIRVIGLSTDRSYIRQFYTEKQRLFLMGYHRIRDISDLYEYVLDPDYAALTDKLRQALKESDVALTITDQIAYRNDDRF